MFSVIYFLFLPCIISFLGLSFGWLWGRQGVNILTVLGLLSSFLFFFFVFVQVTVTGSSIVSQNFIWCNVGNFVVYWGFLFDGLSILFLLMVCFISLLVHCYSIDYMAVDPHTIRFMSYLSLFTFFMCLLVTANNFLQLFFGWEGVGLCSYLLVSFWHTRVSANKAAIKALAINRIGDISLLLGMGLLYVHFKSLDFGVIFSLVEYYHIVTIQFSGYTINVLMLIGFFIFGGAVGKSAQLGLHTWLPDAMEGPTPVSALIHAATMVTAGVFLLIRCSPLLECVPNLLFFIALFGAITTLFASLVGSNQVDIKKIIAYSTCGQLGYMVLACGLSNYTLALYHVLTHAFYKALLFLGAGSVIHAVNDEQDFRKMGGLAKLLPLTYSTMLIGSTALMGFPYMAGFFSKDLILNSLFTNTLLFSLFFKNVLILSTLGTIIYSIKLLFFIFWAPVNGVKSTYEVVHEAKSTSGLIVPLLFLSIASIFIGQLLDELLNSSSYVFQSTILGSSLIVEYAANVVLVVPFWIVCLGTIGTSLYYWLLGKFCFSTITDKMSIISIKMITEWAQICLEFSRYLVVVQRFKSWLLFHRNLRVQFIIKGAFDYIQNQYIAYPLLLAIYKNFYLMYEKGFFEFFGPTGFWFNFNWLGNIISKYHLNKIANFVFFLLGFIGLFYFSFYLFIL